MSFTPTPRTKIALDNNKLTLSAPSTAPNARASLTWMLVKNAPRIVVWTRDPADMTEKNGNGKIQAELDAPVFASILETINSLIDQPPNTRYKLENKNHTFFGGKRSDEAVVVSEIWVGKDKEGYVYISVTAPTRPVIKFRIQPSMYHTWYNATGEKLEPEAVAKVYVKGYVKILRDIYDHLAITEFVDLQAEKNARNAGQGGGGKQWGNNNNRSGGNGGGYNNNNNDSAPAASVKPDDDLPF